MTRYRISREARMDLARIYWHGVERFGERQAERYYEAMIQRFGDIGDAPYQYPAVDHIRQGYRRSVCGTDSIYYRVTGEIAEIMRVLGRQDVMSRL